jgi:hypothetical protein
MNKILYTVHRINKIKDLVKIPINYGIEIDLRDYKNTLILNHDPFFNIDEVDTFENYIKFYNHNFLILNVKSECIEFKILEILKKNDVNNYFFLDCSFPMIYKLINNNEYNIALRLSEFESIDNILKLKNKIKWVWIDCFTKLPLNKLNYEILKQNNFKLCIVSPELQNQQNKINEYKKYIINENLFPDMICTKDYNIDLWNN